MANSDNIARFEALWDRNQFSTLKWERLQQRFGRTDILPMWVADADLPTVPEVVEALIERARHPFYGYTFLPESYLDAVVGWYAKRHNISVQPEWIVECPGGIASLHVTMDALLGGDDQVLVQTPAYHCFFGAIEGSGRRLVRSELRLEGGRWCMDFEHLQATLAAGVKLIVLCSPHNPVGRIWNRDELLKVLELADRYGAYIFADEIFSDIVFSKFCSTLELGSFDRLIVLSSPTKTFNIAGLQLGQMIVPSKELRAKIRKARESHGNEGPNAFSVVGAEVAYRKGEPWLDAFLTYIRGNFELFADGLRERGLPFQFDLPDATYLAWIDGRSSNIAPRELFEWFVQRARIACNNGVACGPGGEGFIRLNLACPRSTISEALARLGSAYA